MRCYNISIVIFKNEKFLDIVNLKNKHNLGKYYIYIYILRKQIISYLDFKQYSQYIFIYFRNVGEF